MKQFCCILDNDPSARAKCFVKAWEWISEFMDPSSQASGAIKDRLFMENLFRENEPVDTLGPKIEQILTDTEPNVSPQQLLEIVTESLRKTVPSGLSEKASQRVLAFLVETEYRHNLRPHILSAVHLRAHGRWNEANQDDNSDRVDALVAQYKEVAGIEEDPSSPESLEVNQPVGPGGLTRLHMAAMDGEFEEVIRLIEKEGASPLIQDNMKKTPYDRARAFGNHLIAEYLKQKMA